MMWIHRLLHPHCPDCAQKEREAYARSRERELEEKHEHEDERVCESCETLKAQLALANEREQKLMERLLEKPAPLPETKPVPVSQNKRMLPWRVQRQMLEEADRQRAKLMREAPKPDASPSTVEDLEKELGVDNGEEMDSVGH